VFDVFDLLISFVINFCLSLCMCLVQCFNQRMVSFVSYVSLFIYLDVRSPVRYLFMSGCLYFYHVYIGSRFLSLCSLFVR